MMLPYRVPRPPMMTMSSMLSMMGVMLRTEAGLTIPQPHGEKDPGEGGDGGAENDGQDLVAEGVVAQGGGPRFVVADGLEHPTDRGAHEPQQADEEKDRPTRESNNRSSAGR